MMTALPTRSAGLRQDHTAANPSSWGGRQVIVEINSDWRIKTDPHQWILQRRRNNGKKWNAVGYFRDLGNLFPVLVNKQIYETDLVLYLPERWHHSTGL